MGFPIHNQYVNPWGTTRQEESATSFYLHVCLDFVRGEMGVYKRFVVFFEVSTFEI